MIEGVVCEVFAVTPTRKQAGEKGMAFGVDMSVGEYSSRVMWSEAAGRETAKGKVKLVNTSLGQSNAERCKNE